MPATGQACDPFVRRSKSAAERGVECLTLFAFSSENWRRPEEEVSNLMGLFVEALRREVDELHRNNVRLRFIGARKQLKPGLVKKIDVAEARTAGNSGLELNVAVAYGGRWDIVEAARKLATKSPTAQCACPKSTRRHLRANSSWPGHPMRTF